MKKNSGVIGPDNAMDFWNIIIQKIEDIMRILKLMESLPGTWAPKRTIGRNMGEELKELRDLRISQEQLKQCIEDFRKYIPRDKEDELFGEQ